MSPRERFLNALKGEAVDRPCVGTPTSIATTDLMESEDCTFPEVHTNGEKMAKLAAVGHEVLGYDTVAPYFSVINEAAALGANMSWGDMSHMPAVRRPYLFEEPKDFHIPPDFLERVPTRAVLEAISLLRQRFGDEVAIIGKVFGPWTLAYHLFGIEEFLVLTLDNPGKVRRILDVLKEVTLVFAQAQIEAGADSLTLGDHLTGDLCRAEMYRDYLLPVHQELSRRIDCPIILHICGFTLDRLDYIADSGFAAFHFDSRNDAREAMAIAGERIKLAGNVSNVPSIVSGDQQSIEDQVRYAIDAGVAVIGPECAVPLNASSEALRWIVDAASCASGGGLSG
ncbi:MAG: uroporphyrinogen decarboxylase family protein [Planctomycetota bacterium]|jgi:[methyl-Co(III) methanol-specific corrinoid protein]:coenzyme M methyltransferase|nr:uroporphyrinogen decarboxylase family protein [Planctomycetota bacterium]MDP7249306.1 uroporphyrinogen decarboxylase family protein [Planctomycetota bacterium]